MRLVKYRLGSGQEGIGVWDDPGIRPLLPSGQFRSLTDILESEDPAGTAKFLLDPSATFIPVEAVRLLAPVDRQEIWAAGVTYRRSRSARMEESQDAEDFYDKVYQSDRPELFFKATPHRTSGPDEPVRIRHDATWNVPEPELALVLNSRLDLVGYTIGNDMSSRDIEGENPLYLPQAKVYDACCSLGPCITLESALSDVGSLEIELTVHRNGDVAFEGKTSVGQMARSFDNLIDYLGRDNTFPDGVILLTGTGIVPDSNFTLLPSDRIEISINGIGTLVNRVIQS